MILKVPPALRHRRFFLLWLGLLISIAGSRMQLWALFWHIRELTDQPIALGAVGAARILPVLALSLIGGALADMRSRRRILFVSNLGMAAVAAVLGLITVENRATLALIYLLTAIQAVGISFELPARQALIPNLVPERDLPNAFSIQSIAFQVGAIVGPALSGLFIAQLGLASTYFFNAASYLAVILALLLMGPVPQRRDPRPRPGLSPAAIAEGVRFTVRNPLILASMLLDFLASFFSRGDTLMPIFARDILNVGPVAYGWLSAAQSIGATAAALVLSQIETLRRQGLVLLISVFIFGAATVAFGASRSFALSMGALITVGAADSVSAVIRNTIRQLQTPDHLRGRMTSVNQLFFMGGPELGEIEAGVVAQFLGAPFAVVSGGVAAMLATSWIAGRWPQLRRYNGDEPVLAGASAG